MNNEKNRRDRGFFSEIIDEEVNLMDITFIYNRRTYLFMSLKDFAIVCKLGRDEAM